MHGGRHRLASGDLHRYHGLPRNPPLLQRPAVPAGKARRLQPYGDKHFCLPPFRYPNDRGVLDDVCTFTSYRDEVGAPEKPGYHGERSVLAVFEPAGRDSAADVCDE